MSVPRIATLVAPAPIPGRAAPVPVRGRVASSPIPSRVSPVPVRGRVTSAALLACATLLAATGSLQAQSDDGSGEIVGRVVDADTGAPIWGAFVSLPDAEVGFLTDSVGRFALPVPDRRAYVLVAEQLGYVDATVRVEPARLDESVEIRIRPDPVALEEIRVLGNRFQRERRSFAGSVRVLETLDLARRSGQTAFDVLMGLGVTHRIRPCGRGGSEEWCVVRRGRLEPIRVVIDEIPVVFGGLDWLRDYDAGELYLLEVYDQGRAIRVLTRWAVEERPAQLAALRSLPVLPSAVEGLHAHASSAWRRSPITRR